MLLNWLLPKYDSAKTLSLAGVAMAAQQVESIANTGTYNEEFVDYGIQALFMQDADSALDVFQSSAELNHIALQSLNALESSISGASNNKSSFRYFVQILQLQKLLVRQPELLGKVGEGITQISRLEDIVEANQDLIIARFADLYTSTISKLSFRIQVQGKPLYLDQDKFAQRIRVLLLSGIRFSVLWRQLDGKTLDLVLNKNRIERAVQATKQD